jgi:hypothetical protein
MKSKLTCVARYGVFVLALFYGPEIRLWGHDVGEPELEKLPIWKTCCREGDCFPQAVNVLKKTENEKTISVDIEGVNIAVEKEKFSPVPSSRTWVCYINPNGEIKDENIRCILYPQKSGTT